MIILSSLKRNETHHSTKEKAETALNAPYQEASRKYEKTHESWRDFCTGASKGAKGSRKIARNDQI